MNKSVFEFNSYKAFMKYRLRETGERGALSRAAEAINCQRSYLSRVMDIDVHLTPDHGFLLSVHLKLSGSEKDYFNTMIEYERAANKEFRAYLLAKLNELRNKHESLSERLERQPPGLPSAQQMTYFSTWHWSAIHFLTASPEFQTAQALSARLGVSPIQVEHFLKKLSEMGLIRKVGNRWEYDSGSFHLPKESPLVVQHHQNWRARAILDAQIPSEGGMHYTNVQTLSKADFPALIEVMLKFVEGCKQVLDPSGDEEVVAITCDVFKI